MANSNRPERRSIWRVGTESTWTTVLPVAFIIVSLLSLVILPLAVSRHTGKLRAQITRIAEPARRSANQMQIDLSAELDKVIAYQVTGQPQYRADYATLLHEQEANRKLLATLAPKLGGRVKDGLDRLINETHRWHTGVSNGEFLARQLPQEVFLTRLYERHPSYEKSLSAASDLEMAIQADIEGRLQRIHDVERIDITLTLILTALALTSALLVAGLGRQMRLLAREAMRRRQEAEHDATDARNARAQAEREERRAAFLASAGQELAASLAYEETIESLARLIVANLADAVVIDIAEGEDALRRVAVVSRDEARQGEVSETVGRIFDRIPEGVAKILTERVPRLVGGTSEVVRYFMGGVESDDQSAAIVPLVSRGEVLGVVAALARNGRKFAPDDLSLLTELARHGSLAIDNARLYLESQQAVRAREEVLAIVSHDLRNPLSAVSLGASLLKTSESLTPDDREQLETIDISARRMNRLIADLLDVTRLEGGKRLPIEPSEVEVESLFSETYELFRAQALQGSIELDYEIGDGVDGIHADRHRMIQVLSNLIGNALKFTPREGSVTYRARRENSSILFGVSDTGPGIPEEHLGDIFNPYWQAKRTERLGAGLGLPIAKGIVEAHGGKIWVESGSSGTTFYFRLPVEGRRESEVSAE